MWTLETQHVDEALSIFFGLPTTLTGPSHGVHFDSASCVCALRSRTFHAIQRFEERALVVKQKIHHDGRKHQCFTPQMESMLAEAECCCAKLSMTNFLAKCRDNTCICAHHGIQILPRGQRGIRIEQHASTSFDDKRHTATQEQTHASQQGMFGREVCRDRTEIT